VRRDLNHAAADYGSREVHVSDSPLRTQPNEGDALSPVDGGGIPRTVHKCGRVIAV